MSLNLSDLREHLQASATTLCFAWIIARKDGVKLGFTDHDQPLLVEGVLCEPKTGFNASAIESAAGLAGDTSDVEGVLSSDQISADDIAVNRYDGAIIYHYIVNWNAPDQNGLLRKHYIGEITLADNQYKVELRSYSALLDTPRGRYFRKHCDANLGDEKCGIDMNINARSAVGLIVSSASNSNQTIVVHADGAFSDEHFANGHALWQSGKMSGQSAAIARSKATSSDGDVVISLVHDLPFFPQLGDRVRLLVGCDKSFSTCKSKFNNGQAFRGFPHMPGNEKALTYSDGKTTYDGAPLVS